MPYVIVTGYVGRSAFFPTWYDNTIRHSKPARIYVVNSATPMEYGRCDWINVKNLGHIAGMPADQQLGGWSAGFMMGCLLAYHNFADLIYKEEDCLAFGPWVDRLYEEMGSKGAIIGGRNTSPGLESFYAQSLCLVRHSFLLPFMNAYLAITESDKLNLPEHKFQQMMMGDIATTTMGYDRSRPINFDDQAFYAQQLTDSELHELRRREMI